MVRFAPHSPILLVVLAVATLATACPRPQPPIMPTATFQGDVAPTLEALATQNAQLATEMRRHDLELRGTIEALATQSASMATRVPRWEDATSYLLTQVPAQGRVSTVAALATQNAYLSTPSRRTISRLWHPHASAAQHGDARPPASPHVHGGCPSSDRPPNPRAGDLSG
ncbi:MAG TPA: hypothetical protein DEP84_04145 [Chloroflexi bacterium]|nr:hypothetical protein [Chloroflexota bacterium]